MIKHDKFDDASDDETLIPAETTVVDGGIAVSTVIDGIVVPAISLTGLKQRGLSNSSVTSAIDAPINDTDGKFAMQDNATERMTNIPQPSFQSPLPLQPSSLITLPTDTPLDVPGPRPSMTTEIPISSVPPPDPRISLYVAAIDNGLAFPYS
jgi:hypothetical protein